MTASWEPIPVAVQTLFGVGIIHGPYADEFTRLNWQWADHWSGESATFRAAGLEAYVKDMDGDASLWQIKDMRSGKVIAEGQDHEHSPPHFWRCLVLAEAMLRAIVFWRKTQIIRRKRGIRS